MFSRRKISGINNENKLDGRFTKKSELKNKNNETYKFFSVLQENLPNKISLVLKNALNNVENNYPLANVKISSHQNLLLLEDNLPERKLLVPANPFLNTKIPDWLIVYSIAPFELDYNLKWEIFELKHLEAFEAMLKRIFMQELERIVMKYENYRMVLSRKLEESLYNSHRNKKFFKHSTETKFYKSPLKSIVEKPRSFLPLKPYSSKHSSFYNFQKKPKHEFKLKLFSMNNSTFFTPLKEELNNKLIECGWKDEVKELCKKAAAKLAEEKGLENIIADDLINDITPKARAMVPDQIKVDLLNQVKDYLEKQPEFQ